jgi:tetratricopeptide (TPR) repeat protein
VRRATELDARSDQAWYGLAVCYAQKRNYTAAIDALRNALARREVSAQYHTALGEILVYRGYTDEGQKHYARALEVKPDYGPACALMGHFLLRNASAPDSLDRAEELLRRATGLQTMRPADVWLDLGQLYTQKAQFPKAVDALERAIGEDPRDERMYYALASAYRRMGDAKKAAAVDARFQRISALHVRMQDLEARLTHAPRDAATHLELARVDRDLGLYDRAAAHYATALRLQPQPPAITAEWRQFLSEHAPPAGQSSGQTGDFALPPLQP